VRVNKRKDRNPAAFERQQKAVKALRRTVMKQASTELSVFATTPGVTAEQMLELVTNRSTSPKSVTMMARLNKEVEAYSLAYQRFFCFVFCFLVCERYFGASCGLRGICKARTLRQTLKPAIRVWLGESGSFRDGLLRNYSQAFLACSVECGFNGALLQQFTNLFVAGTVTRSKVAVMASKLYCTAPSCVKEGERAINISLGMMGRAFITAGPTYTNFADRFRMYRSSCL
jgi:hypothetical protein